MSLCSCREYTGGSPTAKSTLRRDTEESAKKYELQTRDITTSIVSMESPPPVPAHASNYRSLPPNGSSRSSAALSDTQRGSTPRDYCRPVGHSASVETFNPHTAAGNAATAAAKTSSLQQRGDPRLQGIPEHSAQSTTDEKYVAMMPNTLPQTRRASEAIEHRKRSLDITDSPRGIGEGLDPTSLYDVPSSVLAKGQGSLPHNPHGLPDISEDPLSVYDIPKSALIAAGHYKVPPIDLGVCQDFDMYDVPPSASALYDVPPSTSALYDVPPLDSSLYDVPPSALSKVRKYSQPTSQQEVVEIHQSVTESEGPDDVFSTYDIPQRLMTSAEQSVPDYSHYDVPKNLMLAYYAEESQSPTHATKEGLSRRNSSPTHVKSGSIYDVPRNVLAESGTNISAPPTAPKPSKHSSRKGSMTSRSRSASSPIEFASPAHKPHPNEAFYDIPPLDPDVIAQTESKPATSHEPDTVHITSKGKHGQVTPTHSKMQSPKRTQSVPVKGKKKVPPPTRTKPEKETLPPPTRSKPGKKVAREHK